MEPAGIQVVKVFDFLNDRPTWSPPHDDQPVNHDQVHQIQNHPRDPHQGKRLGPGQRDPLVIKEGFKGYDGDHDQHERNTPFDLQEFFVLRQRSGRLLHLFGGIANPQPWMMSQGAENQDA